MPADLGELVHFVKKVNGKFERRSGIQAFPSGKDHVFVPEQTFTDSGGSIAVNSFVNKVKVPDDSPAEAKINFDRPVASDEYAVVFPGTGKTFGRIATAVYVEAPSGQTTKVRIEALKMT